MWFLWLIDRWFKYWSLELNSQVARIILTLFNRKIPAPIASRETHQPMSYLQRAHEKDTSIPAQMPSGQVSWSTFSCLESENQPIRSHQVEGFWGVTSLRGRDSYTSMTQVPTCFSKNFKDLSSAWPSGVLTLKLCPARHLPQRNGSWRKKREAQLCTSWANTFRDLYLRFEFA